MENDPTMTEPVAPAGPAPSADGAASHAERQMSEEAASQEATEQLSAASADLERLEAEKADLTDRLLRLAADMENLRRRAERDVADARKYAVAKFAGDMLTVADNLRRALDAAPADRRAADDGFKALFEGVEMTAREMDRLLEKNGVTRIVAMGERFDPNRHQAVFQAPDAGVPEGTVVQVMQDGYAIGDRILRAAMVGVSVGGAARQGEAQAADAPAA